MTMTPPIEGEFKEAKQEAGLVVREETQIGLAQEPDLVLSQAHKAAAALQKVINGKTKKVQFNGEQYLELEDWILLGEFYGVAVKTEWTRPFEYGDAKGWEAKSVIVDKRSGVEVGSAEAMCLDDERNWKGKPTYQIRSMAQTRASAKALSARLRWVPVLAGYKGTPADEMQGSVAETPAAAAPAKTPMRAGAIEEIKATYKSIAEEKKAKPLDVKIQTFMKEWIEFMKTECGGKWDNLWADDSLAAKAYKIMGLEAPPPVGAPEFDPDEIPS